MKGKLRSIGILVVAIALCGLAGFVVRRVFLKPAPSAFLTEGFDFALLRARDIDWRGPDLGHKLDLSQLEDRSGKTLASVIGKGPAMLVAVNSDCGCVP